MTAVASSTLFAAPVTAVDASDLHVIGATDAADATARSVPHVTTVAGQTYGENDSISVAADITIDGRLLKAGLWYFPVATINANVNDMVTLSAGTGDTLYTANGNITGSRTVGLNNGALVLAGITGANTGAYQFQPGLTYMNSGDGTASGTMSFGAFGATLQHLAGGNTAQFEANVNGLGLNVSATQDLRVNSDPGVNGQLLATGGPGAKPYWFTLPDIAALEARIAVLEAGVPVIPADSVGGNTTQASWSEGQLQAVYDAQSGGAGPDDVPQSVIDAAAPLLAGLGTNQWIAYLGHNVWWYRNNSSAWAKFGSQFKGSFGAYIPHIFVTRP
ncbi:MAG: hypothetical protein ACR2RL_21745 [Gammaproteobacteria bacterium]